MNKSEVVLIKVATVSKFPDFICDFHLTVYTHS